MRVVNRQEIEAVVKLDSEVIDIVEEAFSDLIKKSVQMPPIMRIDVPENNGEVDIKSAYVAGLDSFAIKISSGFFNNDQLGLPSANGLMLLLSSETGIPKAVLADDGYLTEIRTAAAGAVAAKYLAKENSSVAGVIGTGAQARYQVKAIAQVRSLEKVLVYGRTPEKVQQYKEEIEAELNVTVEIKPDAEQVVRNSDIVVTTTPATEPIIQSEWLHPGLHITAMGSDAEHKQELEAAVLENADVVICDVKEQSVRLGELRTCQSKQVVEQASELGEITSGTIQGRTNEEQVTTCDLTGTGVQDTAIARYAYSLLSDKNQLEEE